MKQTLRFVLLLAAAHWAVCEPHTFTAAITGSGKPMILIPGLECPGTVWDSTVAHYKDRYQLHVLSIAGFGGLPAAPDLRLSAVRDEIIGYIRQNHLDHPVIMGHSLGGFLALWVAATAPDLPGSVVSLDGLPFLPALGNASATAESGRQNASMMKKMYASLAPAQMEAISRLALSQMVADPKNVETVTAWAARSDPAFVGQAIYDMMTTDLRPEVSRIRVPVLLMAAGKNMDEKTRAAYQAQIAPISRGKLAVASHSLHFIMFDDPDFLFRTADAFLAGEASHVR